MANKCSFCGSTIVIGGVKDGENYFCRDICLENFRYPGFCPACTADTTDLSPGGVSSVNGIGTVLYGGTKRLEMFKYGEGGGSGKCPTCFSVIKTKWWALCFIPIIRLKTYRVKNVALNRYLGRFLPPENLQASQSRTTKINT